MKFSIGERVKVTSKDYVYLSQNDIIGTITDVKERPNSRPGEKVYDVSLDTAIMIGSSTWDSLCFLIDQIELYDGHIDYPIPVFEIQ